MIRDYGSSSYSICVPNLKFVGFSFRKIRRTSGLSISRPGDLDLWSWNWCALLPVGWATFLSISVFLGLCVLDLWANNTCQTHHVISRHWPLTLEVMALVGDMGLRSPSPYHVWRTSCLSISRPGDFNLWPWNWCALLPVEWATFISMLVFLERFVVCLLANTCQTHHVTSRPWPLTLRSWH